MNFRALRHDLFQRILFDGVAKSQPHPLPDTHRFAVEEPGVRRCADPWGTRDTHADVEDDDIFLALLRYNRSLQRKRPDDAFAGRLETFRQFLTLRNELLPELECLFEDRLLPRTRDVSGLDHLHGDHISHRRLLLGG